MLTPMATSASWYEAPHPEAGPEGATSFGPSAPMKETPRSLRKYRDVDVVAGEPGGVGPGTQALPDASTDRCRAG